MVYLKLEKLDGRHKASKSFTHRVMISGPAPERIPKFIEVREWCQTVWGNSMERELYLYLLKNNELIDPTRPVWSWHFDGTGWDSHLYIYLKGEEQQVYFKLKWL